MYPANVRASLLAIGDRVRFYEDGPAFTVTAVRLYPSMVSVDTDSARYPHATMQRDRRVILAN